MCNALNHCFGCGCGFGGDGHLGRRSRFYRGEAGSGPNRSWHKWHGKPMRELASELGRSLLFPATCRNCGDSIYLFADPNGGFAMFDEAEPPWPKHRCWHDSDNHAPIHEVPLPLIPIWGYYKPGQELKGVIVDARPEGKFYRLTLFRGKKFFYSTLSVRSLEVGAFIKGVAHFIPKVGTCLQEIEEIVPPDDFARDEKNSRFLSQLITSNAF